MDRLCRLYEEALSVDGVVGLVVGTRPDCVSDALLDYFALLHRRCFVLLEYGVESVNDVTLTRVNRGHTYACSAAAIYRTASRGIPVGAHMILGLPGESKSDILRQPVALSALPLNTLKLHQLQLVRGTYGLTLTKQKLHHILTNPFYAGKIRHKMLEGKLVDGNQPHIVSYDDFLRVQEILSDRTGVYTHKKETPRYPLKRHVLCAKDHTPFTAYTVKKKNLDYYKCNQIGCKTNESAKKLHSKYERVLHSFNIPHELTSILRDIISRMIAVDDEEQRKTEALLKKQKTECQNKMKKCKVRFGMGDIDEDIYEATVETLQERLTKIDLELANCKRNLSNFNSEVDDTLAICCELDTLWKNASLELSQRIQNLLFPDGILWDKEIDDYRTFHENKALSIIAKISSDYKNKKEKNSSEFSSSVFLCA